MNPHRAQRKAARAQEMAVAHDQQARDFIVAISRVDPAPRMKPPKRKIPLLTKRSLGG